MTVTITPVIAPLPDDVQVVLDAIANKTPNDLLDAINDVTDAIRALHPTDTTAEVRGTGGAPSFASAAAAPQSVQVTFGDLVLHVSGEGKDERLIAQETVREFRRLVRAQSGDSLQFGIR